MGQSNFYDAKCETIAREELEQLQIERLQSTLNRVYRNVSFYRSALDAHRVDLEKVTSVEALRALPFTTKDDLRLSYPYSLFAVPLRDIVRIHSTLGTPGRPVVVGYTRNDLRNWNECTARLLVAAGITEHDVVQIALDYNITPGAFGFHHGAELVGASVIPSSLTMGVEKQLLIMRDFKTTILITTPAYAVTIAAGLEQANLHPEQLSLRLGLFGGQRWSDQLRSQLEQRLRILSVDTYGVTEILGPGVAGECHCRDGLHINEDHFIVEIVDPKTLQPVSDGDEGELVLTTITREGFPLIRYRTGDITSIRRAPCPCGRTFARMARVMARTDDMIFFRGVGFFPSQVEQIVSGFAGVSDHYQIVLDQIAGLDTLEVRIEVSDQIPSWDEMRTLETLRADLARRIKTVLDVDAKVTFVERQSLQGLPEDRRVMDSRPGARDL
jgi:phenylacetate-CoA ligase